jgi:hypothetical protein
MRTVINVGLCLGLVATALVLLFFARNVIWNIPDAQLPKIQKRKILCWVAVGLGVVIFFLYPRNWDSGNQYIPQSTPMLVRIAPPPTIAVPVMPATVEASQPNYAPVSRPAQTIQAQPRVQVDRWAAFSTIAQSVIAKDLLDLEDDAFQKQFTIRCLDATSSTRQITSYGMNSSVVVVTGRYKIATVNQADGQGWSKTFSVSETVFPEEFQGLDSSTTMVLLANSLKEQISDDKETMTAFGKISK